MNKCINNNCSNQTNHPSGYCDECRAYLEEGYQELLGGEKPKQEKVKEGQTK